MKKLIVAFMISTTLASAAYALELQSARASGQVCEKADGYIEKTSGGSEVNALVSEVNAGRKAEYTRISKENGQSVEVVAKIAAGKITAGPKCR